MRVPLAIVVAVCVWSCLILWVTAPAWAASRHLFPNMRADAFLRGGDRHEGGDVDALYLYGTLSLLERQVGPYRVDVAKTKHRHLLPLATLDIYHDIQTYTQTEFSDYTIWGILADFMFYDASRIAYDVERSQALRRIQAVQRRHGRDRSLLAYPDAVGGVLSAVGPEGLQAQSSQRVLGAGARPSERRPGQSLFDLRGDHVFKFEESVRHHGEQRQFYARSSYPAGRGGRNYNPEGLIARALQRILQVAHVLVDHKMLTLAGLAIAMTFIKMAQNMLLRQR